MSTEDGGDLLTKLFVNLSQQGLCLNKKFPEKYDHFLAFAVYRTDLHDNHIWDVVDGYILEQSSEDECYEIMINQVKMNSAP